MHSLTPATADHLLGRCATSLALCEVGEGRVPTLLVDSPPAPPAPRGASNCRAAETRLDFLHSQDRSKFVPHTGLPEFGGRRVGGTVSKSAPVGVPKARSMERGETVPGTPRRVGSPTPLPSPWRRRLQ